MPSKKKRTKATPIEATEEKASGNVANSTRFDSGAIDLDPQTQADSSPRNEEHHVEEELTIQKEEQVEFNALADSTKKLTRREIIKLKKKKQRDELTGDELSKYSEVLGVTESVSLKAGKDNVQALTAKDPTSGATLPVSGLSDYNQKNSDYNDKNIFFDNITISYQSKPLLKEACLRLPYGRKFGLIGHNGSGKSTLLRHLSHRYLPVQEGIRILHLEQEAEASSLSALEYVINTDKQRLTLLAEEVALKLRISDEVIDDREKDDEDFDVRNGALSRLVEVYDELRAINAYSAESRASTILSGLQFTEKMKAMPTSDFSGGWRMRIALASALFLNPDLLILDEPTNHLDLNAVIWLEMYLKRWKGTLLVVSHDRDFLNYFVTDIIHLENFKLDYYRGNYDSFERVVLLNSATNKKSAKKIQLAASVAQKKGQSQQATAIQKRKKQNQQAASTIQKKGQADGNQREYRVQFEFDSPGELVYPVIQVQDMSFAYNPDARREEYLFLNVEKNIDMDDRIAIVGPNGAGKTTFLNLVLGELEPTSGKVVRNRKLKVVKFAQHFIEELEMSENAIAYLEKNHPELDVQQLRTFLGRFGLSGKTHTNPISLLSGGQKSRVMFTNIALKNPHLMFLDEPTNHLDIQSVDALIEALLQFRGGLVIISHDQRLLSRVCNQIWVINGNQKVEDFDGEFWDYRQRLIDDMEETLFDQWQELEQEKYNQKTTK